MSGAKLVNLLEHGALCAAGSVLAAAYAILTTSNVFADDGGLQTVVAGDLVSEFDLGESSASDRLDVRGVELGLFAPIDHAFAALVSFAAHPGSEGLGVELHEAVMTAPGLDVPFDLKVGQFFLGVGRLNQIHQHDWPFLTTPLIHSTVMDSEEGALDTGLETKWLSPWFPATEISLGVTNGWTFGHSHTKGTKPREPLIYARVTVFGDSELLGFTNAASGVLLGASWVRRRPDRKADSDLDLFGVDLTLKIREANRLLWLWTSEGWYRRLQPEGGQKEELWGLYSFLERHVWRRLSIGARAEYLTDLSQTDILGRAETNETWKTGPTLTWTNSEFLVFRFEYLYESQQIKDETREGHSVALQSAFILGSHPAHNF